MHARAAHAHKLLQCMKLFFFLMHIQRARDRDALMPGVSSTRENVDLTHSIARAEIACPLLHADSMINEKKCLNSLL